ncbi:Membrane protein involved in the export of O-antigen and teichoic acid [Porphyromonadaceae bacterium NLAE-zl-C104]|nr:Membrane protein involved in the export of O-antigen and teichoic acid [Porphyromonadaceae bacterium NLAE-zl-C104]
MTKSLKQQTILGVVWSSVQKFGTLIISFIGNIVLARLLTPSDFGAIGMLMVFIALSETLIDGGFGSALIQKKSPTNTDYSTIFYWNIILAILLYSILFVSAPFIASFYNIAALNDLLKVLGIILLINSFNIIQSNILTKSLKFKVLAKRDIISISIGTIIAIILAYKGFGVWSLVVNYLITALIKSILLWTTCDWRPQLIFSWVSFKGLFKFGSYMLLYSLLDKFVFHLQALIIGRSFSANDLGFYTQAKKIHEIPERSFPSIINQVTFPVFASIQDNTEMIINAVKKTMRTTSFVTFPIMVILIVIAEPLITFLLTEKWNESVNYFQILCFGGILYSINSNNLNVIKALGKSNYLFKSTIVKRSISILFIIIGIQFGIKEMIAGYTISIYFWFFINSFITGKLTGYGFVQQVKELGLNYLLSLVVGLIVYFTTKELITGLLIKILLQVCFYSLLYLTGSYILRIDGYKYFSAIVKEQGWKIQNKIQKWKR